MGDDGGKPPEIGQAGFPPFKKHRLMASGHSDSSNGTAQLKNPSQLPLSPSEAPPQPTALQQHVLFWDRDNDGIIFPQDVYNGFRDLGFNILFSIGSLLIPIFFSYPTGLAYSWIPDPLFRIHVPSIHKAKHGSDTSVFDIDGHFHADRFEEMFSRWDVDRRGGLTAEQVFAMWKKNRLAADVAGWCFAFMEMCTTWLLLQRDGRVWKEDLRGCYDGTLFWTISEAVKKGEWKQGYGIEDFFEGMVQGGTWKKWELKKPENKEHSKVSAQG
jgi:peroxygenase